MPLRDHFRPPFSTQLSWEEFHGGWPMVIVQQLRKRLPAGFVTGPRVHSGSQVEIDVATLAVEADLSEFDEYEVRVYDATRGRTLVAAIELVSPANKDRPEHRNVFVAKCAALLQKGVAVSVVDLVTVRQFNLYAELLALVGHADPTMSAGPPALYAASCRWVRRGKRTMLETWSHALIVGRPLPTLPLWLGPDRAVPLDLEKSYEQACNDLWVP